MNALTDRIRTADHFVLVAALSLVILTVNVRDEPLVMVGVGAATVALLTHHGLLRSPWPWFVLGAVVGVSQARVWWTVDDHVVVTTYWILGIGLSRVADDPRRFLAVTARLLVGLVFAFAFSWKLLSSQFLTTDFFRYELVEDDRLVLVAEYVAGVDDDDDAANEARLDDLRRNGDAGDTVVLEEGSRSREVAVLFTAWGLAIEGVTAAAFLLPLRGRATVLRPACLLAFSFTTYLVVPVAGFGALLVTLGLAERDTARTRLAFATSFVFLLVWGAVFPSVL